MAKSSSCNKKTEASKAGQAKKTMPGGYGKKK